jgi:Ca2+-binding EF-hand superfamily protein
MTSGKATRDLDKEGLTTEQFVAAVAGRLDQSMIKMFPSTTIEVVPSVDVGPVDHEAIRTLFGQLDKDGNGVIDLKEFADGLKLLGITPVKVNRVDAERKIEQKAARERESEGGD